MPSYIPDEVRLEDYMPVTETGCWLWMGSIDKCGYGYFRRIEYIGKKKIFRNILAHRFFYKKHKGEIPDNKPLDHLCRVTSCVNPAHLEPVTVAENNRRKLLHSKYRTVCINGHERNEANGYFNPASKHIKCRLCQKEYNKKYRNKNKCP